MPLWAYALTSTHYDFTPATPEHHKLQLHVNLDGSVPLEVREDYGMPVPVAGNRFLRQGWSS